MKELTIEQKAQRYDDALERAKDFMNGEAHYELKMGENIMCWVFPELRESEDERIRKMLIEFFGKGAENNSSTNGISDKDILAWLEKQGENCLVNFDEAEKEKYDFVSGQFIECRKSFNGFKEDNSYWLEYIGDDNYIGRSDNILNQKFHITPRQLFTLFTWQHRPKENNVNEETNAPTGYGKYVDECLNEASKHFFSEGEDKYSVADLFYAGVRCGKSWLEKQCEQKSFDYENANIQQKDFAPKVKPKFKVGDFVINGYGFIMKIVGIEDTCYKYIVIVGSDEERVLDCPFDKMEESCHLWTIQDAKDGDVLANDTIVLIVDHLGTFENRPIIYSWYFADSNKFYGMGPSEPDRWEVGGFHPATKEQRDLLFKKMKEAGYEWDVEKKELKLLITNGGDFESDVQMQTLKDALLLRHQKECIKPNNS